MANRNIGNNHGGKNLTIDATPKSADEISHLPLYHTPQTTNLELCEL